MRGTSQRRRPQAALPVDDITGGQVCCLPWSY